MRPQMRECFANCREAEKGFCAFYTIHLVSRAGMRLVRCDEQLPSGHANSSETEVERCGRQNCKVTPGPWTICRTANVVGFSPMIRLC